MKFVETFFSKVLARVRKNQVAVADALPLLPTWVEDRRVDKSHPRNVGIGFGRYIQSAGAGSFNHGQALRRVAQTRAVDVHDVKRSARDGGSSDHFTHRLDRGSGLDAARTADVSVNRNPPLGGQSEHIDDLQPRSTGRVLNSHSDRQSTSAQL